MFIRLFMCSFIHLSIFLCVCVYVCLCVCVYVVYSGTCGSLKRALYLMKLELQEVMDAGNQS